MSWNSCGFAACATGDAEAIAPSVATKIEVSILKMMVMGLDKLCVE